MSVQITWRGEELKNALAKAKSEGLLRATVYFHDLCRRAVSKSNPRNRKTGENDRPSLPGEPPRLRTGFGRDNIVWGYNDNPQAPSTRVGVQANALYMYFLEIGFSRRSITIYAKPGRKLMIPWGKDDPTEKEIREVGLKKIGGKWFYFRRQVTLPATHVAARPWLLSTLETNKDRIAMLAATSGASEIK